MPIQIVKRTDLELPPSLGSPFLLARYNNARITLSEADVYLILEERKAVSVGVAEAIAALEQKFAQLASAPKPLSEAQAKPRIRTERNDVQAREILMSHEINVLFLHGLLKGKANLETNEGPIRAIEIQYYTSFENNWKTNGIRFMYRASPVYDYCSITPPAVSEKANS